MERHIPEAIERVRNDARRAPAGGLGGNGGADSPVRRHRLHRPAHRRGDGRARPASRCSRRETQTKLDELAAELGGELETQTADVSDPPSVARAGGAGRRPGHDRRPVRALGTARGGGRHHQAARTTSTRPASRSSSARCSSATAPPAEQAGIGMLTAMGYDWVPGQPRRRAGAGPRGRAGHARGRRLLHHRRRARGRAGARGLAGRRDDGARVRVPRRPRPDRSAAPSACAASGSARRSCPAISVGSSEHFALPRLAPRLREVNAYLGWFGPASRADAGLLGGHLRRDEGARRGEALGVGERALRAGLDRQARTQATRAKSGSHIVAHRVRRRRPRRSARCT